MKEVEKREFGRQLETPEQAASPETHAALRLLASNPTAFLRQGSVVATYRYRNGRKFGPYYCLNYREEGQRRSIYLGQAGELVEQVRQKLQTIQRPRVEFRQWNKLEQQVRRSFRLHKQNTRQYLQLFGLRWKGNRICGWRNCPLRQFATKSGHRPPPLVKPFPRPSCRVKTPTADGAAPERTEPLKLLAPNSTTLAIWRRSSRTDRAGAKGLTPQAFTTKLLRPKPLEAIAGVRRPPGRLPRRGCNPFLAPLDCVQ